MRGWHAFLITAALSGAASADVWDEQTDGGGDTGQTPATAQVIAGAGPLRLINGVLAVNPTDIDMYAFAVTAPASFTATTVGLTDWDTQLFLFDESGGGVTMNDDDFSGPSLQSRLSGRFVDQTGIFFIAITRYNNDPLNLPQSFIWNNTPTRQERAPDNPDNGGNVVLSNWGGQSLGAVGPYSIRLTGAEFIDTTPPCQGDIDGDSEVGLQDLAVLLTNFGAGDATPEQGDVDGDGDVDLSDLAIVLVNFGRMCP